jgi:hypothetical protein
VCPPPPGSVAVAVLRCRRPSRRPRRLCCPRFPACTHRPCRQPPPHRLRPHQRRRRARRPRPRSRRSAATVGPSSLTMPISATAVAKLSRRSIPRMRRRQCSVGSRPPVTAPRPSWPRRNRAVPCVTRRSHRPRGSVAPAARGSMIQTWLLSCRLRTPRPVPAVVLKWSPGPASAVTAERDSRARMDHRRRGTRWAGRQPPVRFAVRRRPGTWRSAGSVSKRWEHE